MVVNRVAFLCFIFAQYKCNMSFKVNVTLYVVLQTNCPIVNFSSSIPWCSRCDGVYIPCINTVARQIWTRNTGFQEVPQVSERRAISYTSLFIWISWRQGRNCKDVNLAHLLETTCPDRILCLDACTFKANKFIWLSEIDWLKDNCIS